MTGEAAPATQEEKDQDAEGHAVLQRASDDLAKARQAGKVDLPEMVGYVGFVAPVEQNTKILANPAETENPVIRLRDQNSATGQRDTQRTNDVWITFVHGSFVTNDPIAIEWCRTHTDICRDVSDPLTSTWYFLKMGQTPLSNRQPTVPAEVDIDAALGGDLTKLGGEADAVSKTRDFAEQANEREAVEA